MDIPVVGHVGDTSSVFFRRLVAGRIPVIRDADDHHSRLPRAREVVGERANIRTNIVVMVLPVRFEFDSHASPPATSASS